MMSIFQGGRYSFTRADHWRAGVFDNFEVLPSGLQAPAALGFMPVPGTVGLEPDALPAFDPCGQLYWLRARVGELVRHYDFGNEVQGTLVNARNAKALVLGVSVIWVLAGNRIHRYAAATRQLLGTIMPVYGRRVSIAPDGGNGLWALEVWQADGVLRHYDALGRRCGRDIKVERLAEGAAIATTQNGLSIVVLAAGGAVDGADGRAHDKRWRLVVVDVTTRITRSHEFTADASEPIPRRIAIDRHDHVYVMPRVGQSPVQTCSLQGEVLARRTPPIAAGWRKIRAIAACNDIVIAGRRGLARLSEGEGSRSEAEVVSTFITPTLIAPDGQENRWNFADIEAVVAEGNTVEISVAASRNPISGIDALFQDRKLSQAERFKAIDGRLPWRDNKTVYPGKAEEPALETLRFLLNGLSEKSGGGLSTERQLPDTHIWLRVRFHALPGRLPPQFKSLNVTYPEQTYLQFLPAIYREKPIPAEQLRLFLAPVEALFDDIDSKVDGLPRRIDPATAPEQWYAFLLRWLGFPLVDGLDVGVRKKLLLAAPELLARRGTMRALQQVLDIVTGGQALVRDSAAMPRPWILPAADADGVRIGPRLGFETLVVEEDVKPLRLGGGTTLGHAPLNETCADPIRLIEECNAQITITAGIAPAERQRLEPIIWSLLRQFVPAHCRVRLVLVSSARLRARIGLESGFVIASGEPGETPSASRLADDRGGRLGSTSDLGCWRLPEPAFSFPRLDRYAIANGAQNLN